MKQKITKQYITENLIRADGYLNNRKTMKLEESQKDLYLIFHNLKEAPKCECGNDSSFQGFAKGFGVFCSLKCSNKCGKTIQKKKATKLKHFGDENYNNMYKNKNTKLERYGNENYNNRNQSKETCLKKYGVEHVTQYALCSNTGFGYKSYTYPSGKIVQIQGYENYLLDELIKVYNEEDILTDRKDMPEFWYYTTNGKKHKYFPDVYIPKDNTIYEVKSVWTLELSKKEGIFELKEQSVLDSGYKFILSLF